MNENQSANETFVITRTFDAPRSLVWKAFTEAEHLAQWFGPKGVTIAKCTIDLKPGGLFHYCMRTADGHEMWGKWVFQEIRAPERLVVITSFSDAKAGATRHPMVPDWPLETLSTSTFTEQDGKTTLKLEWSPYKSTDSERKCFRNGHAGMQQGWGGTFAQLDAYLALAQS